MIKYMTMTGCPWSRLLLVVVWLVLLFVSVRSQSCTQIDLCSCKLDDGSVVDITSLGNTDNTPRFKDVSSDEGNFYSYNPCYPFDENDCTAAATCILSPDKAQSLNIGDASKAAFTYDSESNNVVVAYTDGQIGQLRVSEVDLVCDEDACEPEFTSQGQTTDFFQMTLKTVCACPNGCSASGPKNCSKSGGISAGTILCIMLISIIAVYLIAGVMFMKFVKKKEGKEIVPNQSFWSSLPTNIRAGVYFTLGKCIPRFRQKTYESI